MATKVVYNSCYGGFGLSLKAVDWLKKKGCTLPEPEADYGIYLQYLFDNLDRHNPLLVQCVEELGDDASGECAKLKICEIAGNVYRIDEYDGMETVVEPPDQDWISV